MSLPVELSLALRYLRPRRWFVWLITLLTIGGVALGVWAPIVVLSVMAGFEQRLAEKIVGFNAHITVAMTDGSVLYDYDKLVDLIKKQPGVVAAAPFIRGPVLVEHNGEMSPAFIKSVPENGDDPVLPLKQYLIMGDWELRGDSVLVGKQWSQRNAAFPGDKITVYGAAQVESYLHRNDKGPHTIALPNDLNIQGVFETGQFDYDLNFLLVSTETAQEIWGMPNAVHGIEVRVKSLDDAEPVRDELNRVLPDTLHARTWMDDNRDLFNQIAVERVVMALILYIVFFVAAFGLCSTLITTTIQKSSEIGLMKALGARDSQVCWVFLINGTVVGAIGTFLGTVSGLLVLHNLNHVRDFLFTVLHVEVFRSSVYGLPEIPVIITPWTVVAVDASAIVICLLAALIPAMTAATLAPARALRYE